MAITDHAAYIDSVRAAARSPENSWTWGDPEGFPDDEATEVSDAAIAIACHLDYLDRTDGDKAARGGIISFPDGQALAWHEEEGWTHLDFYGISTPLELPVDATPAQVVKAAKAADRG